MKLDRTTYEAWLLDRIEGHLSPAQARELDAFLAANPDLDADTAGLPALDGGKPEPIDWKADLKKRLPPAGLPDRARLNEFLVARVEGDLGEEQEQALDKFLFEHPEHEQDAKRIAASKVNGTPIAFEHKETVQRHFPPIGLPDKHRLMDFLIASQEGDLSADQQQALTGYLAKHPEAQLEQRLVAAAHVVAERVVFTGKDGLKKREVRVIALWQRYAVAASIALLLGFAWWVMRIEQPDGPEMAKTEREKPGQAKSPGEGSGTETPRVKEETSGPLGSGVESPREQDGTPVSGPQSRPDNKVKGSGGAGGTTPAERKEQPTPSMIPAAPEPEPQLVETPQPIKGEAEPALAQEPIPHVESPGTNSPMEFATASVDRSAEGGTRIGTVLANTVRNGVLETDQRASGLDQDDALAVVNKGLGAITGGHGAVETERQGTRGRWKLRLSQHLSISASTGR